MRSEMKAAIVTAVLIMGIAVLFRSVLNKAQDVVPLFMVPAFVYGLPDLLGGVQGMADTDLGGHHRPGIALRAAVVLRHGYLRGVKR